MHPVDLSHPDSRVLSISTRSGSGLPRGLKKCKIIGKGANNTVWLVRDKSGATYAFRVPRTNSDTQRLASASLEFAHSARASRLGIAPALYDAWYTRHATDSQKCGLHVISTYYPRDVHSVVADAPYECPPFTALLRMHTTKHLRAMADDCMLCYDLKPSNMVFSEAPFDMRFIDFGCDYCEAREYSDKCTYSADAPVLHAMQLLVDRYAKEESTNRKCCAELYRDAIYAVMLIMLSANIGHTVERNSSAIRCSVSSRSSLNFLAIAAHELHQNTHPSFGKLIREVLRIKDIRGTMRHYMGRRNSGTKRCFTYAGFRTACARP